MKGFFSVMLFFFFLVVGISVPTMSCELGDTGENVVDDAGPYNLPSLSAGSVVVSVEIASPEGGDDSHSNLSSLNGDSTALPMANFDDSQNYNLNDEIESTTYNERFEYPRTWMIHELTENLVTSGRVAGHTCFHSDDWPKLFD